MIQQNVTFIVYTQALGALTDYNTLTDKFLVCLVIYSSFDDSGIRDEERAGKTAWLYTRESGGTDF